MTSPLSTLALRGAPSLFFFQAEDGIRCFHVTGVQTCALPILFRESMAENAAMIFVFARPDYRSFWMKNVSLPLSCAYIDPDGVILEIHDMKPQEQTPIEAKTDRIQYVLETKQGWFERNKVTVGMVVRTERGSLAETFFGQR